MIIQPIQKQIYLLASMSTRLNTIIRYTANGFIFLGILLFIINFIGLFDYTTITGDEVEGISDHPRTVSELDFWENAYQRHGETVIDYVTRLTELIDNRMISIDPQYARPTFFENWILWLRSQFVGHHEWVDTRRAVRLGGGYCSQHAIILNNLLSEQGIESRILGLSGHVINEVLINGQWKVYDSNYDVVFDESLSELELHPERVYQTYVNAGYNDGLARLLQEIYGTPENNMYFKDSSAYVFIAYFIFEKLALKLIWYIPGILLTAGVVIRVWLGRRTPASE